MAKKKSLAEKIAANRRRIDGTAAGLAMELRIDIAQLTFRILKMGGAKPQDLVAPTRFRAQKVNSILSADCNLTMEDIGTIAFALGVNFHLRAERLA